VPTVTREFFVCRTAEWARILARERRDEATAKAPRGPRAAKREHGLRERGYWSALLFAWAPRRKLTDPPATLGPLGTEALAGALERRNARYRAAAEQGDGRIYDLAPRSSDDLRRLRGAESPVMIPKLDR
jgi:hypothetical protein